MIPRREPIEKLISIFWLAGLIYYNHSSF